MARQSLYVQLSKREKKQQLRAQLNNTMEREEPEVKQWPIPEEAQ